MMEWWRTESIKFFGVVWGDCRNLPCCGADVVLLLAVGTASLCWESHDTESGCSCLSCGRAVVECAIAMANERLVVTLSMGTMFYDAALGCCVRPTRQGGRCWVRTEVW